jgi:hypothetical protein
MWGIPRRSGSHPLPLHNMGTLAIALTLRQTIAYLSIFPLPLCIARLLLFSHLRVFVRVQFPFLLW